MSVCLFSALSRKVGALQISIIIIKAIPHSIGTYFFIGTSGSFATGQSGQLELTVDGAEISFVSTPDQSPLQTASVHGVVHLTQGQQVWLRVTSGITLRSTATSFSGFLVTSDQ